MFDFASDMSDIFLTSGFQETITYIPETSEGVHISAIVYRDSDSVNTLGKSSVQVHQYDTQIYVSRTDVPVVKVNADKVMLPAQPGDTTLKTYRVQKIIRMDAGAYRLGLGA